MIILGNGQHHTYISIFSVFVCDYTTNQFCIYNLINLNEALLGRKLGLQNSKKKYSDILLSNCTHAQN